MTLRRLIDAVQDQYGNAVVGAPVTITVQATGAAATLYETTSLGSALGSNVIDTDEYGLYSCFLADGVYKVSVLYDGTNTIEREYQFVGLGDEDVPPLFSPVRYGATGVNDTVALQAAITAAGGVDKVQITVDTPTEVSGATMLQTAAETIVKGHGDNTLLTITEASASGTSYAFDMGADGLTLADMAIDVVKSQVGVSTLILCSPEFDDMVLRGLKINCGNALVTGTQDRSTQLVKANTTAGIEGVTFAENYAENFSRAYTRDNANAAAHKRVKGYCNVWKNAWRTVYTFNAPSGSIEDVLVIGDTFDTHAGIVNADSSMAGNNNAIGMEGVRGGRVIGNHVTGTYGALLHIEENADCVVAIANTARMANEGSTNAAIEITANNISGVAVTPQNVALIGHVLQSTDGVGKGIYLQSGASLDALEWGVVSNNIVDAFDEAYRVDTDARTVLVTDNVLKGVTNAMELTRASLLVHHNLVEVVAEPIHVTRGGMVGAVHYANLASATAGITAFGASAGGPLVLTEWTWESGLFAVGTGTTYVDLGPMPTRAYGMFSIVLSFNASIHRHLEVLFEYDGATITNTSKLAYGAGDLSSLVPANNAGQLAVTLVNAGALTSALARLQVRFHSGQFIV